MRRIFFPEFLGALVGRGAAFFKFLCAGVAMAPLAIVGDSTLHFAGVFAGTTAGLATAARNVFLVVSESSGAATAGAATSLARSGFAVPPTDFVLAALRGFLVDTEPSGVVIAGAATSVRGASTGASDAAAFALFTVLESSGVATPGVALSLTRSSFEATAANFDFAADRGFFVDSKSSDVATVGAATDIIAAGSCSAPGGFAFFIVPEILSVFADGTIASVTGAA